MKTLKQLTPKTILIWILLASAALGVFLVSDFSMAFDDGHHIRLAKLSLEAYSPRFEHGPQKFLDIGVDRYYGPAFNMFSQLASESLQTIWPQISISNVYQYTQFLSFLLAGYCIFLISQHFMEDWIALITSLLFLTQPLLLGHGFINPKDTPFMAFFTASIATGLTMVNSHKPAESIPFQPRPVLDRLKEDWKPLPPRNKRIVIFLMVLLLITLLGPIVFNTTLDNLIASTVSSFYHAEGSSFWGSLFHQFTERSSQLPVEAYIHKGTLLFYRAVSGLSIVVFITLIYFTHRLLPEFTNTIWRSYLMPVLSEFHPRSIVNGIKQRDLLVASLVLGLASSMRIIGPAAGGLVALYAIGKLKKNSLPVLVTYFGIAAIVMFITWPFLWGNPAKNYLDGWSVFSNFPWLGGVLFNGKKYLSTKLPSSYLPTLIGIQLTEPALILAVISLILVLFRKIDKNLDKVQLLILFLWFFAPLLYVLIFHPVMYDNFRQFLFIIPPIVILAGIGLQHIIRRINHIQLNLLLALFVLIPGIVNSIQLHPYEYIYYNSFVGGVEGAFRQYEPDYWFTAHKEAIEYLNQVAPPNAKIVMTSGKNIVDLYAREDLEIIRFNQITKPITDYDYFIQHTRSNKDMKTEIPGSIIFQVGKKNAVYDWVIKIEPKP